MNLYSSITKHGIILSKSWLYFFFKFILANVIHCQRPRRGPAIIPHPNLKLKPGTSSSVVSRNEEKPSSGGGSVSCEPKFLE